MRTLTVAFTLNLLAGVIAVAAPVDPAAELLGSAHLWERNERDDLSRLALQKLLRMQPDNAQALYQLAVIELRANQPELAQQYLEQLQRSNPASPYVQELKEQIRINTKERAAMAKVQLLVHGGRYDEAYLALLHLFPDGPPRGDLGIEYYRIVALSSNGLPRARAGLQGLARQYPDDARYRRALAELGDAQTVARANRGARSYGLSRDEKFWNAMKRAGAALDRGDYAAADAALDRAEKIRPGDARARVRRNDIALARLRTQAEAAAQQQHTSAAIRHYEAAIALAPRDAWLRYDLAALYRQLQMPDLAQAVMDDGVALSPDDPEMAYAAALIHAGNDDRVRARAALAGVDADRRTPKMLELEQRLQDSENAERAQAALDQARLFAAQRDAAAAQEQLAIARAAQPHDDSVAVQAGWIAANLGDYAQAADYFESARKQQLQQGESEGSAQRGLNYLDSLREGYVLAGVEFSEKDGDSGISELQRRIVPVDIRLPLDYDEQLFVRADYLDLDAGTLSLDNFSQAEKFGKVLAYTPPFASGAVAESAQGWMFGVGYETGPWRFDIGRMPSAFPVSYWVGGVRYANYTAANSLVVDVSRRPVTSSLLSFAGVEDPITGEVWGGVHSTGVDARISRRVPALARMFDVYAGAGWHQLDGDNVLSNSELRLRSGADWNVVERADSTVTLGVAVNYWRYAENESFYTFGHGGYYSPQSYISFGVPIEWSGRRNQMTWRLRGVLSQSFSSEDDMPYYPTDAALQRQAESTAAANDLPAPFHEGGSGSGSSYALRGAVEYNLDRRWAVGAKFDIERSDFYEPNTFGLYLRYRFTPHRGEYELPQPPVPYAYY